MEHCAEQRIGGMAGVAQQTRGGCGDEQDGYQNEQGKCSHLLLLLLQISFYWWPDSESRIILGNENGKVAHVCVCLCVQGLFGEIRERRLFHRDVVPRPHVNGLGPQSGVEVDALALLGVQRSLACAVSELSAYVFTPNSEPKGGMAPVMHFYWIGLPREKLQSQSTPRRRLRS